ncbi:hypothetical protein BT63DRAFT_484125 [Microthyrium microscopicum]|uniref:Peroxin 22-like protein n=1 Tax=Microthyrium microscopicum TaxID=703497 RepID=A0A6A6TZ95_9PEZI|nr:hypothetical protein BT63DRAFT_484125 [Microthyrium microscopicum]
MAGFSYDRYDSRRRVASSRRSSHTILGFWVPVLVTTTLAAGAITAWVFRARDDHDSTSNSEDDEHLSYGGDTDREEHRGGIRPPSYGVSEGVVREDSSLLGRVQSTIRRSPSPQQLYDGATKRVAAGVAAVGAVAGSALSAIREDREDDFADHERWGEARGQAGKRAVGSAGGKRRNIAIVVSAEEGMMPMEEEEDRGWKSEHASLLSHIPQMDPATTNLLILIYAPRYQPHASTGAQGAKPLSSLASSYSAINTPAVTPGEELHSIDPMPVTPALSARSSGSSFYDMLHKQASRLVSDQVNIMPFSTPSGHVHMLKHLSPAVVYIADSLAGPSGKYIEDIRGWVGQIVVVVGGDGAGLVDDTEDEGPGAEGKGKQWWETSQSVGLGKGIEVVEAVRVGDDWERRVGGRD